VRVMDVFYSFLIEPWIVILTRPIFFGEVVIGGILSGVMYSLVALGFVLIYKASGVFNFAQGVMVLFASLSLVGLMERGVPLLIAALQGTEGSSLAERQAAIAAVVKLAAEAGFVFTAQEYTEAVPAGEVPEAEDDEDDDGEGDEGDEGDEIEPVAEARREVEARREPRAAAAAAALAERAAPIDSRTQEQPRESFS